MAFYYSLASHASYIAVCNSYDELLHDDDDALDAV